MHPRIKLNLYLKVKQFSNDSIEADKYQVESGSSIISFILCLVIFFFAFLGIKKCQIFIIHNTNMYFCRTELERSYSTRMKSNKASSTIK